MTGHDPFADWLRTRIKARWGNSKSQSGIANLLGISTGLLSSLLSGKATATPKTMEKLRKAFGLSPDEERAMRETQVDSQKQAARDGSSSVASNSNGDDEAEVAGKYNRSTAGILVPHLMTVRHQDRAILVEKVQKSGRGRSPKRIVLLLAHPGDGRAFLASSVTNVVRSEMGSASDDNAVHEFDLNGWYLRHRFVCAEARFFSSGIDEESIAEAILGDLTRLSPRRTGAGDIRPHSDSAADTGKRMTCVEALAAYFTSVAKPGKRPLLTLHYPSLQETPDQDNRETLVISNKLSALALDLVRKSPDLRILLACPIGFDDESVERFVLQRLSAQDLSVMVAHLLPDVAILRKLVASMETVPAFTIDQYGLLLGRIRERLTKSERISEHSVDEIRSIWESEIQQFAQHPIDRVTFDYGISHDTTSVAEARRLYDILPPLQQAALAAASQFPDGFSVGDIRRVLEYSLPAHSETTTRRDNEWWRERGRLRTVLHELIRSGWMYTEFQSSERGFQFRVRVSLRIFLDQISRLAPPRDPAEPPGAEWTGNSDSSASLHLVDRRKLLSSYCRASVSPDEDIYYRGVYFVHQVAAIRHRLNSLFAGLNFAREIRDHNSVFRLTVNISRLYNAEAQWNQMRELTQASLSNLTIHNDRISLRSLPDASGSHISQSQDPIEKTYLIRRYRFRLQFLFLLSCFQLDRYWACLPATDEERLGIFYRKFYSGLPGAGIQPHNKSEFQGRFPEDIPGYDGDDSVMDKQDLSAECGYWILYLVRQSNVVVGLEDNQQLVERALFFFKRALQRMRRVRERLASRTTPAARQTQFIAHAESVDLERAVCEAYYWEARTAAQIDVSWRKDETKAEGIRDMFRRALAEAERAECYRELVFNLIWLARIDLLSHVGAQATSERWDQAERHLVQAASYVNGSDRTIGGDRKVNNLLMSNWDLLQMKRLPSGHHNRQRIVDRLGNSWRDYQLMGDSYWASFSKIMVAQEIARMNVDMSVEYLSQAIDSWKQIETSCDGYGLSVAPPVLFIDMMNDACRSIIASRRSNDGNNVIDLQQAIRHWHRKRRRSGLSSPLV